MISDSARFAYMNDIKPGEIVCVYGSEKALMGELHRNVMALRAIKRASTVRAIRDALRAPAKVAKESGDTELLAMFVEAATKRKKELETQ